ncbi:MAG TPA: AzlC family ABC transporter permease, partial [Promineifilum sp.]|nr:AzlC family ABC transporter permease [Promineifilum sp.]
MPSLNRSEFLAGVRAEVPIVIGVVPFGLIFGAVAVGGENAAGGLAPALAQAMSSVVFAGSAQFIGVQLMAGGAASFVLLLTTLVVNLRHLLYSASLAPYVRHLPLRWRLLLAYLLTDEAYAPTIIRYLEVDAPRAAGHWFFLGAGLALWFGGLDSMAGALSLGTIVLFINSATRFFDPVHELARVLTDVQSAQASTERVMGLLASVPEIRDSDEVRQAIRNHAGCSREGLAIDGLDDRIGTIEFRDVTFAYKQGQQVLEHFNLT